MGGRECDGGIFVSERAGERERGKESESKGRSEWVREGGME